MKRARIPIPYAVLALCLATGVARAERILDASVYYQYNDNILDGGRARDVYGDSNYGANVHIGAFGLANPYLRASFTADFANSVWAEFGEFSNVSVGGTGALRWRFGLGAYAPYIRVEAAAAYTGYQDNSISGADYKTGVTLGKRFTEQFSGSVSYAFENDLARARVFDRAGNSIAVDLAYDVTPSTRLSAGYQFRDGDVLSFATYGWDDEKALASAAAPKDLLHGRFVPYNLSARTNSFSIGISQALTRKTSIDFRYWYGETERGPISYRSNVFTASFNASF